MKRRYFLPLAAGLVLGVTLLPAPVWSWVRWGIFLGYSPLWLAWLGEARGRTIFWQGWIAQFVISLISCNWLAHTMREFGFVPWPAALAILILFGAVANLHIPLAGLIWHRHLRGTSVGTNCLSVAAVTAFAEQLIPQLFPWNLGYPWLREGWPGFQLAEAVGFVGLSSVTILLNGLLLFAWQKRHDRLRRWWALAAFGAVLVALNMGGAWLGQASPRPDRTLRVLLVQADIGNKRKHEAERGGKFLAAIVEEYLELSRSGLRDGGARPDVVVWPETAFPDVMLDPGLREERTKALREFVVRENVRLITGGYTVRPSDLTIANAAFFLGPPGRWIAPPYEKVVLLPFGEYIPGASFVPALKKLLPHVRDFGAGKSPTVVDMGNGLRLGLQICYEGVFGWFTRELVQNGATVLLNLTNDSWYGYWQQPYQHLYVTMARAVESRRPLIRATNTGISGVALADGSFLELSRVGEKRAITYEVPYASSPREPLYAGWGRWFMPSLLVALTVFALISDRRRTSA